MTTKVLKRDVVRIRQEWAKCEGLWLRYWRLPEAWANAYVDVINESRVQSLADRLLHDIEEERELTEQDRIWAHASLEKNLRAMIRVAREPMEIDKERLDALPKLVDKLREKSGGDHRKLSKRFDQVYQFIPLFDALQDDGKRRNALPNFVLKFGEASGFDYRKLSKTLAKADERVSFSRVYNITHISYPENIVEEVFETLEFFAAIEQKVMSELITPEYIERKFIVLRNLKKKLKKCSL